jgi:tetratricopeptide (TPR) repeat protein
MRKLRIAVNEEPPRPSARLGTTEELPGVAANRGFEPKKLCRLVRGELDWIVLKALEKDRGRRYESASDLAQDVQNHLQDQPVRACPPSVRYRLAKLVRRRRGLVLAGALVLLILLGGIAGTTAGLVQAEGARREAEQERDQKERARREALANLRVARQVVDRMLTRVADERLMFAPHLVEVRRDLLREALAVYKGLLAENQADPELRLETALAFGRLGHVHHRFGQHAEAEQNLGRAVAELERLSAAGRLTPEGREALVGSYIALGWTFGELGRHDEKERVRRQALALAEQLADERPDSARYRQRLAGACIEVGNAWRSQRPAAAADLLRRAIALMAQEGGNRHYRARAHMSLGELHVEGGDLAAAEQAFLRARGLLDQLVRSAPDMWQTRDRLGEVNLLLGRARLAQGRPAQAESPYRRALEVFAKTQEGFSALPYYRDKVALARVELVLLLTLAGRADQARAVYGQLARLQPESPEVSGRLAWLLAMCAEPGLRDPQRAVELARGATQLAPRRALSWRSLGAACYRAGDARGATAALTRSMELGRGGDGFDWFLMGLASARLGEKGQARRWYDDAVRWAGRYRPDDAELRSIRAEAAEALGKEKAASPGAGAHPAALPSGLSP